MNHIFKTCLYALTFATGSISICSCGSEEPNVPENNGTTTGVINPGNVFTGKMPTKIGSTSITLNDEGLVEKIQTADGEIITFNYYCTSRSETSYNKVEMEVNDEGFITNYDMTIGSNGFVSSAYVKEGQPDDKEYQEGTWQLTYDSEGHLTKAFHDYTDTYGHNTYCVNILWENGNPIKSWKDDEEGDWDSYTYCYTSMSYPKLIENKGSLFMFEAIYPIEIYALEWAYYGGILGKGPQNLATSRFENYEDSETEEFVWKFDSNGYPVVFDVKDDDHPGTSTINFLWN